MTEIERQMWLTHDWIPGLECTICRQCARSPISLGFYGDETWKQTHRDYLTSCTGNPADANSNELAFLKRIMDRENEKGE